VSVSDADSNAIMHVTASSMFNYDKFMNPLFQNAIYDTIELITGSTHITHVILCHTEIYLALDTLKLLVE
jgi:hypothetical protein